MSRAGLLGLAVGLVVAATAPVLRRRLAAVLVGAARGGRGVRRAAAGLPERPTPNPLLGLAGLAGAAAVLVLAERRRGDRDGRGGRWSRAGGPAGGPAG